MNLLKIRAWFGVNPTFGSKGIISFHLGQAVKSRKFGGTLPLRRPARVLSWSKLVNFFLDLETPDKLEFTAWSEVNSTFGSRGISI